MNNFARELNVNKIAPLHFLPFIGLKNFGEFSQAVVTSARFSPFDRDFNECRACALVLYIAKQFPDSYVRMLYYVSMGIEFHFTHREKEGDGAHTYAVRPAQKASDMLNVLSHYGPLPTGLLIMSISETMAREWVEAKYFFASIQKGIFLTYCSLLRPTDPDSFYREFASSSDLMPEFLANARRLGGGEPLDYSTMREMLTDRCGFDPEQVNCILTHGAETLRGLFAQSREPEGAPYYTYVKKEECLHDDIRFAVASPIQPTDDRDIIKSAKRSIIFPGVYTFICARLLDFRTTYGESLRIENPDSDKWIVRVSQYGSIESIPDKWQIVGKEFGDAFAYGFAVEETDPASYDHRRKLANMLPSDLTKNSSTTKAAKLLSELPSHMATGKEQLFIVRSTKQGRDGHFTLAHVILISKKRADIQFSDGRISPFTGEGPAITQTYYEITKKTGKATAKCTGNAIFPFRGEECESILRDFASWSDDGRDRLEPFLPGDLTFCVPFGSVEVSPMASSLIAPGAEDGAGSESAVG
ncbi:MAG: hypothetical protein LBF24_02790 [Puniceicoccales bacterium]|nr:hypothetical protein [Puniceicoccales bacterium]